MRDLCMELMRRWPIQATKLVTKRGSEVSLLSVDVVISNADKLLLDVFFYETKWNPVANNEVLGLGRVHLCPQTFR